MAKLPYELWQPREEGQALSAAGVPNTSVSDIRPRFRLHPSFATLHNVTYALCRLQAKAHASSELVSNMPGQ